MRQIIPTQEGDVLLREEAFDLKVGKDLQIYIKPKDKNQFEGLKKFVPKGLTNQQKQALLNDMADYVNQQLRS